MTETEASCSGWIDNLIDSIRNCLGFDESAAQSPRVVNGNGNRNGNGARTVQQPLLYDDFLSSSTHGMERNINNNGGSNGNRIESIERMISVSSIDQNGEGSNGSNPDEFVNRGLLLWNKTRKEWIQSEKYTRKSREFETRISWNATYENLLGTNRPFHRPIPLTEMVDFLVDVWEQEGLYDI
ncbi:hypothetical protein LUZ60_009696 [Juncus effusus]|nr:hypothetical protein LUZ60_009696 [Juncus effusus]